MPRPVGTGFLRLKGLQVKQYTAAEVAALKGCSDSTVRRKAIALEIGKKLGKMHVFTEKEKDRLLSEIQDGPGNPEMGAEQSDKYRQSRGRPKQ